MAAQRAKLVAKRKAAYEAMHGPAKALGGRASAAKQGKRVATANLATASFTSDTAAKTGKPERTIRRDATRAKALGPYLDRVAGTSLDKGAELDALAALSPEIRAPTIERNTARTATSGEVKDLRREATALKELVADLTLENHLLKKV